jgi:hypothetical protein
LGHQAKIGFDKSGELGCAACRHRTASFLVAVPGDGNARRNAAMRSKSIARLRRNLPLEIALDFSPTEQRMARSAAKLEGACSKE